jgi:hypothetical protein
MLNGSRDPFAPFWFTPVLKATLGRYGITVPFRSSEYPRGVVLLSHRDDARGDRLARVRVDE